MKRIFALLALLCLLFQLSMAGPVDQSLALKIASSFFGQGTTTSQLNMTYKAPYKTSHAGKAEENLYYIINRGNDQGFVVIAADNRVSPIIAFAEKGSLTENDIQGNPSIKWLYDEYCNQIKWAIENTPDIPSPEFRQVATMQASNYQIEISPLLEYASDRRTKLTTPISWGQSWPFNQYAPNYRYNGETYETVSGCVATAICTVLRWHKWPRKAHGSVNYYWKRNYMSLNFDGQGSENAAYDWNQMPAGIDRYGRDRTTGRNVTSVQADNVGRLLRDIGYAVQMDYNPAAFGGSGAYVYNAPAVLTRNFGYKNTVRFLQRSDYYEQNWLKEIHDELRDYGPVVYAGFSAGGGHCFVLDGFASNGFVHVDWGWNYSSNGWHKLNVLRPGQEGIGGGSGGYSSNQQMLRYLKPDRNDDPDPEPNPNPEPKPNPQPDVETGSNLYIAAKCQQTTLAQLYSVPVTITIGNKNSESAYSGRLALAFYQEGNDAYSTILSTTTASIGAASTKKITFYANLANVKAGTYNLTVNYAKGTGFKAIDAVAGTVTIGKTDPDPDPTPNPVVKQPELYAVQRVTEYIKKGQNTKIVSTLANEGNADYNGNLKLYVLPAESDNIKAATLISEGNAKIARGERVTFSFYTNDTFKKLEVGKYSLLAGYDVDGEEVAVKVKTDSKVWKIGELTINTPDDSDNDSQTVHDLKLQTIYFYQGGSYLGSDNAYVSTSNSKFTARVYLKSVNGFEGRVKFYVTDAQLSSKPLNSNMTETRTITLKPNNSGYIEVSLPTRYLTKGRYYMNILYNNGGAAWLYYPTDVVPFNVYTALNQPDPSNVFSNKQNLGPTFDFDTPPTYGEHFQSIGNKVDSENIPLGIDEVISGDTELSVHNDFVTDNVTLSVTKASTVRIYSVQGNLISKHNVKAGDNIISVTNLPSGIYFLNIGKTTCKIVKR